MTKSKHEPELLGDVLARVWADREKALKAAKQQPKPKEPKR